MKKTFLARICLLFAPFVAAQEILTPSQLKELTETPDTSNTIYAEKIENTLETKEPEKLSNSTTREDPENPGVFITEVEQPKRESQNKTGITFGEIKSEPPP